ncbi:hypothetical protein [Thermocrispum municipale]|uniref:hypothetical protein n=1 Tax=Thermocrispum municipale TaxID=37926 RepID=UPI0004291286|nr:hypothetical protein [Thermocrispum municipale]
MAGVAGLLTACSAAEQPEGAQSAADPAEASEPAKPVDKPAKHTQQPRDEDKVVTVINSFHKAVDRGDAKRACSLLTKTLQGVYAMNPGAANCVEGVKYTHDHLDGAKMSALKVAPEDVKVKGREAIVSHKLIAKRNDTKAQATDSYNLVRSGKTWKIDYIG